MRNFRNLEIWKDSIQFSLKIYLETRTFPMYERFGICSQLQRASVSVPSNIAEGCSRTSRLEFARFLEFSLGSCYEIESQLLISKSLNYVSEEVYGLLIEDLNGIVARLVKYKLKLTSNVKAPPSANANE